MLSRLFCNLIFVVGLAQAAHATPTLGYQHLSIPDAAGPPIEVGVWYPAAGPEGATPPELFGLKVAEDAPIAGRGLPLVVISHGNGGSFASHVDTAVALVKAGYVVAALTHTGDNYRDQSRAADLANRPRQLKLLVSYMLEVWTDHGVIDSGRVGAFGFSSGGFTLLTAAGGEADLARMGPHCRAHPDFYDCKLVGRAGSAPDIHPAWIHDERLKAVVIAAPAVGFAFDQAGLAHVTLPLQLWRAEDDTILPQPDYAEAVRAALPIPPDYHVVANADHFDFLSPCSPALAQIAPDICQSRPGFDRAAFHQDFNAAVVAFFNKTLRGQ